MLKLARSVRVEFINSEEANTNEHIKILARLSTHRLAVQAIVILLPGDIDIMLGILWLKRFNLNIDWIRSIIKVYDRNSTYKI